MKNKNKMKIKSYNISSKSVVSKKKVTKTATTSRKEKYISKNKSGTYRVRIRRNNNSYDMSFHTLTAARNYKKQILANLGE
jgi:hypothetical protein